MKRYRSHKIVEAAPIHTISDFTIGVIEDGRHARP